MRNDFGTALSFDMTKTETLEEMAAEDERILWETVERLAVTSGDVLSRVLPAMELAYTIKAEGTDAGARQASTMAVDILAYGLTEGAEKVARAMELYADMYEGNPSRLRRPSAFTLPTLPGPHAPELLLEQRPATEDETRRYAGYIASLYRAAASAISEAAEAVVKGLPLEFRDPNTPVNVPTALYFWYDADDALLYIGITGDLVTRQSSHVKRSSWSEFADHSKIRRFPSRSEAERAEKAAIEAERPLFNHVHNDTPEARARLVAYLIEHGRMDLLAPAVSRG